jgi:hypothetical protein
MPKKVNPADNPDPARYMIIHTRDGGTHFRLKRGANGPVDINAALRENVELKKITAPGAKNLLVVLKPHLLGITTGRIITAFSTMLAKAIKQHKRAGYTFFKDFDLQHQNHMLSKLYQGNVHVRVMAKSIDLLYNTWPGSVIRHNQLVTDYYFDAILVSGDPTKEGDLKIDCATSPLYSITSKTGIREHTLTLLRPAEGRPWALFFKISCLEGNELAVSSRHYGMKVVAVG